MIGRRRHQRFTVSTVVTGVIEVTDDAVIVSADGADFVITTRTAPAVGDEAILHVEDSTGTQSIRVRVVQSQLHVVNQDVQHRVRLTRLDGAAALTDTGKLVTE